MSRFSVGARSIASPSSSVTTMASGVASAVTHRGRGRSCCRRRRAGCSRPPRARVRASTANTGSRCSARSARSARPRSSAAWCMRTALRRHARSGRRGRSADNARRPAQHAAPRGRCRGQRPNSPWCCSRSRFFCTLPIVLRGSSSTTNTRLGTLKLAMRRLQRGDDRRAVERRCRAWAPPPPPRLRRSPGAARRPPPIRPRRAAR